MKKITAELIKQYIDEELIVEFDSEEECMEYFNIYDGQNFKSIEEMKEYQGEYGFGFGGKWYHINYEDVMEELTK